MSDTPESKPAQETELGVTFAAAPERAKDAAGQPKVHTPTVEEIAKDSEMSRKAGVFDIAKAFDAKHELGTIVTDKRRRRIRLGEKLRLAFNEWWEKVQRTTFPTLRDIGISISISRKGDQAKIPKAETRAAVIETAATNAAIAPKDDHHVVIEKVKTFKRDVERITGVPFTVKEAPKKPAEAAPRWTHTADSVRVPSPEKPSAPIQLKEAPDLRRSMVAPVVEKHIKRDITDFYKKAPEKKDPVPTPRKTTVANQIAYMHIPGMVKKQPDSVRAPVAPVAPVVQPGALKVPEATPTTSQVPSQKSVGYATNVRPEVPAKPIRQSPPTPIPMPVPVLPKHEIVPEPVAVPEFRERTPQVAPLPEPVLEREPAPPPAPRVRAASRPAPPRTSHAVFIWSAIAGVVVIGSIAALMLLSGGEVPATPAPLERETIVVAPDPEVIVVDTQTPIALAGRETFISELSQKISEAPAGVHQLYPTTQGATGERPVTSEEFLLTLGTGLPESTVRALSDSFVVGSVTAGGNELFIILRSTNFDVLFAGMLAWEGTLPNDFAPLFDGARAGNRAFVDGVRNNRAVRILYGTSGEEVLVYAFVDKSTVVITTSIDALARIIERM